MTPRNQWLTKIRSNPSDWQAMLIFADWLEDEGDLLAAEQWRFLAALALCGFTSRVPVWPAAFRVPAPIYRSERYIIDRHNIRCMPTYPTSLEDVERYYQNAASQPI